METSQQKNILENEQFSKVTIDENVRDEKHEYITDTIISNHTNEASRNVDHEYSKTEASNRMGDGEFASESAEKISAERIESEPVGIERRNKRKIRRKREEDRKNESRKENLEAKQAVTKNSQENEDINYSPGMEPGTISTAHQDEQDAIYSNKNLTDTTSKPTISDTGLLDIFCVQSEFHRHAHYEKKIEISNDANVTNEHKKRRKKKKRLPEIKKRSSKVAITNGLVLPPINSLIQPSSTPRDKFEDKSEIVIEVNKAPADEESIDRKPDREHKRPLWICKLFCRFPFISFAIVTVCHLAVIATTVGLFSTGYDVFPIVFDDLPLYIYNDVRLKELTWREKSQVDGFIYRPVYGFNIATGSRSEIKDTVEVIFEKKGGNILNKYDLNMIKLAEDGLFANSRFQSYFCLVDYSRRCVKPQSLIRLFDGTYAYVDPVFDDVDFTNVTNVIYTASQYNETRDFLYLFLGKDSHIQVDHVYTSITRTFFFMGWPLGRLENNRWGTFHDLQKFLVNEFKPEIHHVRDHHLEGLMEVFYISKVMLEYDLVQQALKDILLAIGSISFIFVFMCFQTGSLTITFLGILSIVSSFLWTNIIYRYVFQYIYFGFFHVIALFLILGIGADDLFVFYDTWRLTGHNIYPSDAHRLSDCYRRAAKTTFVTSCTTMVAFLVSGLSPLLPVRTFGIFAGVLVGINYLWVIIYFPVIILLHHLKFKHIWDKFHSFLLSLWFDDSVTSDTDRKRSSSISTSVTDAPSDANSSRELITKNINSTRAGTGANENKYLNDESQHLNVNKNTDVLTKDKHNEGSELNISIRDSRNDILYDPVELNLAKIAKDTQQQDGVVKKPNKPRKNFEDRNRIVNFLKNGFFDFMTLRVVKFAMPVLFIGTSIFFIVSATKIEPDTHQLRLFRSTHNYAKASDRHYFSFIRNHEDEYQRLYLVWGLKPADIEYCNLKSGKFCHGKAVIDYGFEMNSAESQLAMKNLCASLKNFDPALAEKLRIRRDSVTHELQIACFTEDFEIYFQTESQDASTWTGVRKYPTTMDLSMAITPGNVSQLMSANSQIYRYSLDNDFDRYVQILLSYWMTDGYSLQATSDYFKYNNLLGEHRVDGTKSAYYSYSGLYYGTRTMYIAIEINTTMNLYSLNYKDGMPIFKDWESFIDNINSGMPGPLQNGFQVTENLWHWIHVQETLATSAVTGILIGLFSAWPILVFTTLNFVIGTIAVITIGLVTSCVVGLIPLAGWKLGVLESINLCMVVGLSVDYIVHLAEAYRMSDSSRRLDRVRNMLESIGLSVISGAITTIGAAIFMLFAQVQFFFQFGIFIISTVGISLMFSLFCFTTIMSLIGPQGNTGSLSILFSCFGRFCCSTGEAKSKNARCCPCCKCVSPSIILERIFDWVSYGEGK